MNIGLYLIQTKVFAFIGRVSWLIPYRDVVVLLYELRGMYVMALCGQNREIVDVAARCSVIYHGALKCS
jgi:hypothetical protein